MISKATAILALLAITTQVAYLQNGGQAQQNTNATEQSQGSAAVIIYPIEWDWQMLRDTVDQHCAGGNQVVNATDQQIMDVVISKTVPDDLKGMVFYLSQMIDAEMKRRCPGCAGLSAKPMEFVFNNTSPIPEGCQQTVDGRLCCIDTNMDNLTVCLTYDQMNVFYNYNLAPVCSALQTIATNATICPGAEISCIQQNLFAFLNPAGAMFYFWLHFDAAARDLIFQFCQELAGFSVQDAVFNKAFDFNPAPIIANATQPAANAAQPAANATRPAANATAGGM